MNPQPPEYVGSIFATIFVLMVVFYTIKACSQGTGINVSDNFIIGYLVDEQTPIKQSPVVPPVRKSQTTKAQPVTNKKKAVQKNTTTTTTTTPPPTTTTTTTTTPRPLTNKETVLYNDCIEALVALGMKKTYSRQIAQEIFQQYQINTIQEFIMTSMKVIHNR